MSNPMILLKSEIEILRRECDHNFRAMMQRDANLRQAFQKMAQVIQALEKRIVKLEAGGNDDVCGGCGQVGLGCTCPPLPDAGQPAPPRKIIT